ncbi:MAG TPA: hybrid sensor histidine kinase/response regulator [bacterium]
MDKKGRVLFVDDEEMILNTLKRVFRTSEFDAFFASSATEAMKILSEKGAVDVIVTDYRMDEVDGITLLQLIKDKYPETYRIIITGYPDLEMMQHAVNGAGVFRIILKPWKDSELKEAINAAFEQGKLLQENRLLFELNTEQNRELKKLNERLIEVVEEKTREWIDLKERLVQMDKLSILGFMTSVVAHELKNPLTAILALTEFISKSLDKNSQIYADVKDVETAALRCKDIINRYLKFSSSSMNNEKSLLDIKDVIINAINMMKPVLAKRRQAIEIDVADTIPVKGNFNNLMQVFLNLIRNSMEAMKDGGLIQISNKNGNGSVIVQFSDNGCGIPPEIKDKVFSPFFTTKKDGTGLGLCIVKNIIEEHGGDIKISSDGKTGTTFTISFSTRG